MKTWPIWTVSILASWAGQLTGDPATSHAQSQPLELIGVVVTPHEQSAEMRWRRAPDRELGARVELVLRNSSQAPLPINAPMQLRFDGRTAAELLQDGQWAWHDTPAARPADSFLLPVGDITVWSFNGRGSKWAAGTQHRLEIVLADTSQSLDFTLAAPRAWLSAVTFASDGEAVQPTRMIVHIANGADTPVTIRSTRLWLPQQGTVFLALAPQPAADTLSAFPSNRIIAAGSKGGFVVETGSLPLSYAAVEVQMKDSEQREFSLWAYLRIKREVFDISGGWVSSNIGGQSTLTWEPFLKTLRRLHINTAHIGEVAGYTDNAALYDRYPLKLFNQLQPTEHFDRDELLPRIHAVEFLGEPQYGGGRPVPPQEVWQALAPYQSTRLPTTVTHSEERIWRYYAGLSDYPHYDAYRVTAPSPDAWSQYDRWGGTRLRWGAPLETIGDMTRSLRQLNRPRPIAYWSQGAHAGWDRYGGRSRTSPTPDELRAQAYHALAQRITSLYWFNLSLPSLVKFRDLIEPITRVDREIRLMDQLLLEGDAFQYGRLSRDGRPDWDLASVAGARGMLLFALDLDYTPDLNEKIFRFRTREADVAFELPDWIAAPAEVFRLDADGSHDVQYAVSGRTIRIRDSISVAGIYVVSSEIGMRSQVDRELSELLELERAVSFDPAGNDDDFETLRAHGEE